MERGGYAASAGHKPWDVLQIPSSRKLRTLKRPERPRSCANLCWGGLISIQLARIPGPGRVSRDNFCESICVRHIAHHHVCNHRDVRQRVGLSPLAAWKSISPRRDRAPRQTSLKYPEIIPSSDIPRSSSSRAHCYDSARRDNKQPREACPGEAIRYEPGCRGPMAKACSY